MILCLRAPGRPQSPASVRHASAEDHCIASELGATSIFVHYVKCKPQALNFESAPVLDWLLVLAAKALTIREAGTGLRPPLWHAYQECASKDYHQNLNFSTT